MNRSRGYGVAGYSSGGFSYGDGGGCGGEVVVMAAVEEDVEVCSISSLDIATPHHAQYA